MVISTDAIIPFMPRTVQVQQSPPKLNITRVKKNEKMENSLENQLPQKDLSQWLLYHHQADDKPEEHEPEANNDNKSNPTKHIDILA
jgi:hypothetical protein